MSDHCRTCGVAARIDAPIQMDGFVVQDSYCGACGVNWGVYVKHVAEDIAVRKRRLLKPLENNWRQVAK